MWYPHHGFGWETVIVSGLMMLLFWGGLLALGVWFFRAYVGSNAHRDTYSDENEDHEYTTHRSLDILKERYARGDINRAEFEEKRGDLRA